MKPTDSEHQKEVDPLAKVFMECFWSGFRIFQMFPDIKEKKVSDRHIYEHIPKFTSKESPWKHYS